MSLNHLFGSQQFVSDPSEKEAAGGRKEQVWCEQAVWTLLNVYEEKWRHLDWGNLKGKHWDEVASSLNSFPNGQWLPKSAMQCKNKIEDMKKKYKEKIQKGNAALSSKWPYFTRMETMFKNATKEQANIQCGATSDEEYGDESGEEDDIPYMKSKRKAGVDVPGQNCSNKQRKCSTSEVLGVIKSLGETLVRIESSKMETQRQILQMQAQAEIRQMDMEMKRTELLMNAQLQLAKMISDSLKNNTNSNSSEDTLA